MSANERERAEEREEEVVVTDGPYSSPELSAVLEKGKVLSAEVNISGLDISLDGIEAYMLKRLNDPRYGTKRISLGIWHKGTDTKIPLYFRDQGLSLSDVREFAVAIRSYVLPPETK